MLPPSKKYRACLDELKLWTPVAFEALLSIDFSSDPAEILEQPALDTGEGGGAKERVPGLSRGYALRRYFLASGQMKNLVEVLSALYPERRDQFGSDLAQYELQSEVQRLGELGQQMLAALAVQSLPGLSTVSEASSNVDSLADMLCETRRYLDFLKGTEGASVVPLSIEVLSGSPWENNLRRQLETLDRSKRLELAYRMRAYLTNNYILHSMPVTNERTRNFHETLLSTTRIPGDEMYKIDVDGFLDQMAESDVTDNDFSEVRRTLESLERILTDVPFGDLSDVIGDWGGMPPFDNINVIPSAGRKGACHNTLLATASGSGTSRKGFLSIMRQVRRHLIDCFGKTRVVVLLTDTWDPAKFRESRADIEAHRRRGVVFVTGVVSGRNIGPIPLPF